MRLHIKEIKLPEKETHYRYDDYHYEDGLKVKLQKLYSVKETPCFHYVVDEWYYSYLKRCDLKAMAESKLNHCAPVRKVGKNALRSYCYESKELALNSFMQRKEKQIFHAETAISKATLALKKIAGMSVDEVGESVNCGLDDHLRTFVFD